MWSIKLKTMCSLKWHKFLKAYEKLKKGKMLKNPSYLYIFILRKILGQWLWNYQQQPSVLESAQVELSGNIKVWTILSLGSKDLQSHKMPDQEIIVAFRKLTKIAFGILIHNGWMWMSVTWLCFLKI